MPPQIHSDWLEQLALFKQLQHEMDQDKLQDFYVSVTSLLTSTVFAPWEILIGEWRDWRADE